jgi:hypothetical protein
MWMRRLPAWWLKQPLPRAWLRRVHRERAPVARLTVQPLINWI